MRVVALLGFLVILFTGSAVAQHGAPALTWGPAPASLPPGAKIAVLQGDPSQTALFTIRLDLPDGYTFPPHFHPTDEHVTVIRGTFLVGMGDKADFANAMVLSPGGFVTAGANQHHYARAKGRTIVQVHAMGPFAITWVNSSDDPQRKAASR